MPGPLVGPLALQRAIVKMAPLHLLDAKAQVRTTADKDAIKELANDIRRHGMLQPILLRPGAGGRFTIIAGHRRVTAARTVYDKFFLGSGHPGRLEQSEEVRGRCLRHRFD